MSICRRTVVLSLILLALLCLVPQQTLAADFSASSTFSETNGPTLIKHNGVWYYIKNGTVCHDTTLVKYNGDWWYVVDGKVASNTTTLVKFNGQWWYVVKGKVASNTTTLVKFNGQWWYVVKGKVASNTTTLVKFNGQWWYVVKGKVASNTTTLVKFNGQWWYVVKGKVASSTTTLVKFNGQWWYVVKGKVASNTTTLVKFNGSWYYIYKGKLATKATTLVKFNGAWYYVESGKVNFSETNLVTYGNHSYYVRNGILQNKLSGKVIIKDKTYYIKNGTLTDCHRTGHLWSNWIPVKKSTVSSPETVQHTCARCTITETGQLDNTASGTAYLTEFDFIWCGPIGHQHKAYAEVVAPTCEREGYTIYTCNGCEQVIHVNYTTGHQWSQWVTTTVPIASAPGKAERTCTLCGATEAKSIQQLNPNYEYSYELYFIDDLGMDIYTECSKAIYLKTDYYEPTFSLTINRKNILSWYTTSFDDVEYLDPDDYHNTWRKVPGGYLAFITIETPGDFTVDLIRTVNYEDTTVKSFKIRVLDYETEQNKWIDNVIASQTNSSMNPKEKMDAIASYLRDGKFRYLHNKDDYLIFLAADPTGPWFRSMQWDSCTSPAMLAVFAERIGGFEKIHNCFGDYPRGTYEWTIYHHQTYVVYEGEQFYYSVCPHAETGAIETIPMIDFSNTSQLTRIG